MTRRSRSPIPVLGAAAGLRLRSRAWLVVAFLALAVVHAPSKAQDPAKPPAADPPEAPAAPIDPPATAPTDPPVAAPTETPAAPSDVSATPDGSLFRDPDPSDGPRVFGPLLSAKPPTQLPPPPPDSNGPFQPPGTVAPIPNLGGGAGNGPEPVQQPLLVIPPAFPPLPALPPPPNFNDDQLGPRRTTHIQDPNGPIGVFANWFHKTFLWQGQDYEYITLPSTLLWKPPIGNLREPQFYGIFHNINGQSYIDTAIGAEFGLGRIAPKGKSDPTRQLQNEGLQLDVFGAVFTRFDGRRFLTAIDYRAGIPIVYKKGPWSTKLSYEHTSTHIGDEYSEAYHVLQVPLVLDEVVFGLSRYWGDHLRTYGQFGYAFNTAKESNANNRTRFDWGISYTNYYDTGPVGRPFASFDMDIRSYQNYTPNNSLQIGWQWVQHGRSVRLAFQYFEGMSMFGQFYTKHENWYGFGGYYDF
jgi:hypothetical protein